MPPSQQNEREELFCLSPKVLWIFLKAFSIFFIFWGSHCFLSRSAYSFDYYNWTFLFVVNKNWRTDAQIDFSFCKLNENFSDLQKLHRRLVNREASLHDDEAIPTMTQSIDSHKELSLIIKVVCCKFRFNRRLSEFNRWSTNFSMT